MSLRSPMEDLRFEGREVYWLIRGRFSDSRLTNALLEKTIGMPATTRNITTIRKLAAKYTAAKP